MPLLTSLRYHLGLARAFGVAAAISVGIRRRLGMRKAVKVRWRGEPIVLRPRESDPIVASSVLGWNEYGMGDRAEAALNRLAARWSAKGHTPVIIDGGANVGYAALHFAERFPQAIIIAVEPNPETFKILERNCAAHSQIRTVFGALWSHDRGVSLHSDPDSSWADSVREGADTPSLLMQALLKTVPGGLPLIIKLDIEGAEGEVCRASPELLRKAACLLIEPHDYLRPGSSCLSPLYDALKGQEVDTLLIGEYIALIASSLVRESGPSTPDAREAAVLEAATPRQAPLKQLQPAPVLHASAASD
jgi:FkbM family methyltransferase